MAHPIMFRRQKSGRLPELSSFDSLRYMGAVPVAASNLFKLLSSKSHVLLFPGGIREAFHRKVNPISIALYYEFYLSHRIQIFSLDSF
jgi:hypothetical protein